MKKAFKRYLTYSMKLGKDIADEIYHGIFSPEGVLGGEDETDFAERRVMFENDYGQYLEKKYLKKFLDRLLRNVLNYKWIRNDTGNFFTNNGRNLLVPDYSQVYTMQCSDIKTTTHCMSPHHTILQ